MPYTPPQTSTTLPTIETATSTSTTVIETEKSVPETFTTDPDGPGKEPAVKPVLSVDATFPDATVPGQSKLPSATGPQNTETTDKEQEEVEDSSPITLPQLNNAPILTQTEVKEIFAKVDIAADEPLTLKQVDALLEADLNPVQLNAVLKEVFDEDLTAKETLEVAEVLLDKPLTNDEFKTVIDAIFDEVVVDEVLVGVFEKVLATELSVERFADLVSVLTTADAITEEQVATVVSLVLAQDDGISDSQATELASSAVVLESITEEQAAEVFDAIVAGDLSVEQGSLIVEALLEAPTKVKKSFEKEINVFGGVFDDYVATGSVVDVGTRRAIVAGVAIVFVTPMMPISSSSSRIKS